MSESFNLILDRSINALEVKPHIEPNLINTNLTNLTNPIDSNLTNLTDINLTNINLKPLTKGNRYEEIGTTLNHKANNYANKET